MLKFTWVVVSLSLKISNKYHVLWRVIYGTKLWKTKWNNIFRRVKRSFMVLSYGKYKYRIMAFARELERHESVAKAVVSLLNWKKVDISKCRNSHKKSKLDNSAVAVARYKCLQWATRSPIVWREHCDQTLTNTAIVCSFVVFFRPSATDEKSCR